MSQQLTEIEVREQGLSNSDVVTKYKTAASICNKALAQIVVELQAGVKIVRLCQTGDQVILQQVSQVYKGKTIEKGIAFPTSISCNNCVGHCCPISSDESPELKEGDVAKINLGVHIDGYVATQAFTYIVPGYQDGQNPYIQILEGKKADLIKATQIVFEVYQRLLRPGNKVSQVTEGINKAVENFKCNLVEGVITHQMKRFVIDGNKTILNKPDPENKVEDQDFQENEVYAIDVVVSTGDGKSRVMDEKETTIYKRALDTEYNLKLKASRQIISEINKKYPTMPFTIRCLDNKQMRLGLVECTNHALLHPYPVLYEKQGELVAQIKATVLLVPNGLDRITIAPTQNFQVKIDSDKQIDEITQSILQMSLKYKKKVKKSKNNEVQSENDQQLNIQV